MKNHELIAKLRSEGNRVFIRHVRNYEERWVKVDEETMKKHTRISPKGGKTLVEISLPNGKVFSGESICQKYIFFNKKMGVEVALGRAVKELTNE